MKTATFLRLAALLAFLQFFAHAFLFVSYVPSHGPLEIATVEEMKSHLFKFGGVVAHSYWDLYTGYGLMAALNCLVEVVVFWQLAGLARNNGMKIRPVVALFAVANLIYAFLVWKYFFFVPPMVADLLIATMLAIAWVTARTSQA